MEKRMKGRHVSSIAHHSSRVTRHGFYYRSPMEYLASKGFIPKTLAEIDLESGSVPGAQARIGCWLFVKLKTASEMQRYARYRSVYDIHPSFRFNGEGILLYGDGEIILGEGSYIRRIPQIQAEAGEWAVIGRNVHISHFVKIYTGSTVPDQSFT